MAPLVTTAAVMARAVMTDTPTTLATTTSKVFTHIKAQATSTMTRKPCVGCRNPNTINNKGFFALFAILGVFMVLGGMWFFFWAKNGGFRWQEGDWDDYKSTVLRRKGPDGKTLYSRSSKASTVASEHKQKAQWAAKSVIAVDQTGRKGIMGKRGFGRTHSYAYRDDFTNYDGEYRDDVTMVTRELSGRKRPRTGRSSINEARPPRSNEEEMKQYRSERPAQVGGMNRRAEGSNFEFSGSEAVSDAGPRKSKRRVRAEMAAREESERMELKWRREAERVAALIAKERAARAAQAVGEPAGLSASASAAPRSPRRDARRESRASSPRKREHAPSQTNSDESRSGYHRTARRAERSARHSRRDDVSMPGSFDG